VNYKIYYKTINLLHRLNFEIQYIIHIIICKVMKLILKEFSNYILLNS